MSTAVMGAGAFGTALALSLAQKGPVVLWARDPEHANAMRQTGENNARLSGHSFPETLSVSNILADIQDLDTVLLAVPMQQLRGFLQSAHEALESKTLVACCKGIELGSGRSPIDVITEEIPSARPALLTGPSFAKDIAAGLPTALTLACTDATLGKALQENLSTPTLRLYRTTDVVGAALGGALKNVVAIASGVAIGAGLGESARASLMTRGYAEMQRLALHKGALPDTLAGLSGFGDLVLTCTSAQSRNYRLGLSIGEGAEFNHTTTVEGAATALAVHAMGASQGLDLPITSAVAGLLEKRLDVSTAMTGLLSRSLKEE